ncbi:hypothetical protein THAOC_01288 [Thalassiosira oceanica]|uniref:Uncharacterized protein n=1 Tax=Thalassiosira oceanica TaxID=159749 RepID=K0TIN7_THAOC|nr:hypothetical protein THAOC_01288 [Thalassiosira oceanica]|eukprot:EJK76919.1 hypothetical protein THAOC_01288 [Thalassiosira oceanica]
MDVQDTNDQTARKHGQASVCQHERKTDAATLSGALSPNFTSSRSQASILTELAVWKSRIDQAATPVSPKERSGYRVSIPDPAKQWGPSSPSSSTVAAHDGVHHHRLLEDAQPPLVRCSASLSPPPPSRCCAPPPAPLVVVPLAHAPQYRLPAAPLDTARPLPRPVGYAPSPLYRHLLAPVDLAPFPGRSVGAAESRLLDVLRAAGVLAGLATGAVGDAQAALDDAVGTPVDLALAPLACGGLAPSPAAPLPRPGAGRGGQTGMTLAWRDPTSRDSAAGGRRRQPGEGAPGAWAGAGRTPNRPAVGQAGSTVRSRGGVRRGATPRRSRSRPPGEWTSGGTAAAATDADGSLPTAAAGADPRRRSRTPRRPASSSARRGSTGSGRRTSPPTSACRRVPAPAGGGTPPPQRSPALPRAVPVACSPWPSTPTGLRRLSPAAVDWPWGACPASSGAGRVVGIPAWGAMSVIVPSVVLSPLPRRRLALVMREAAAVAGPCCAIMDDVGRVYHYSGGEVTDELKSIISSIHVDPQVEEIPNGTFQGCSNLTEVQFAREGALQFIGDNAFQGCTALQQVSIPSSVIELGNGHSMTAAT